MNKEYLLQFFPKMEKISRKCFKLISLLKSGKNITLNGERLEKYSFVSYIIRVGHWKSNG
jgi:hypothetical protein